MKQVADFETTVCGIPCGVIVDDCIVVKPFKGSPHLCDSDIDYYGYTEINFTLLDRKGYQADWLRRKMSAEDVELLEEEIIKEEQDE